MIFTKTQTPLNKQLNGHQNIGVVCSSSTTEQRWHSLMLEGNSFDFFFNFIQTFVICISDIIRLNNHIQISYFVLLRLGKIRLHDSPENSELISNLGFDPLLDNIDQDRVLQTSSVL